MTLPLLLTCAISSDAFCAIAFVSSSYPSFKPMRCAFAVAKARSNADLSGSVSFIARASCAMRYGSLSSSSCENPASSAALLANASLCIASQAFNDTGAPYCSA